MNEYSVALDVYSGPLDLLLFLIRRDEVDIYDIPISRITGQYLEYVELVEQLDPEVASEFLVLAATLMEIKSRVLLPRPPVEESDEELVDPRLELVRQLLEYKKHKDAARWLEDAADQRACQHSRQPVAPALDQDEVEIENLQIWDLFEAFRRLLEQIGKTGAVHPVGVDDTPVALHAVDIADSIQRAGGTQEFDEIFAGRCRAEMIGLFLALLELIRQRRILVSQELPFGPILIRLVDSTPLDENYNLDTEQESVSADEEIEAGEEIADPGGEDDEVIEEPAGDGANDPVLPTPLDDGAEPPVDAAIDPSIGPATSSDETSEPHDDTK